MEPSSSTSSVITALKGRTQVHFQPTPADTGAMALSSSPSSSSFAMTSTWQQRLPSWSTSAAEEEEREGERAFRPPERTQSQKYDAWKDIFQRAEHYQDSSRKVQGGEGKADEDAVDFAEVDDGDDEYEYYYEYYYETEEEEEEQKVAVGRDAIRYNQLKGRNKSNAQDDPRRHQQRRLQAPNQHRRRHNRPHQVADRRSDAPDKDYGEESGGALFNDVRRDDGGSAAITLQSLANKDYGAIKTRRRGVTSRIADVVMNPAFAATFLALAVPTIIAGGYYLYLENGPTPVIHERATAGEDPDSSKVASAMTRALFQALVGGRGGENWTSESETS